MLCNPSLVDPFLSLIIFLVQLQHHLFLLSRQSLLPRLELACSSSPERPVSLAWAEGPTTLSYDTSKSKTTRVTLASRGNSACVEFQGQEVLSLQDALRHSTQESIRWHHCKNYALPATSFGCTYKNQKLFLVHKWCVSEETCLVISRLLRPFSMKRSTSKSGTRKDYLLRLRSPTESTFKCLFKGTLLWRGAISTNLRKPEVQDDHEKRMLSNQPQLTRVTPTSLLGSWVLQPIKDMMSLRTDFETHANWQGYIEEPAAKDL